MELTAQPIKHSRVIMTNKALNSYLATQVDSRLFILHIHVVLLY